MAYTGNIKVKKYVEEEDRYIDIEEEEIKPVKKNRKTKGDK